MKLVKSKYSKRLWVEDQNGKRVSHKFKAKRIDEYGPITEIYTEDDYIIVITPDDLIYNHYSHISENAVMDKYYSISSTDVCVTYDKDGRKIKDNMCVIAYYENEGLILAESKGKIGYTDKNLNWVIKPKYLGQEIGFINGRAIVKIDADNRVIIDKKGNHIGTPFKHYFANAISENDDNFFCIRYGSSCGIVDFDGNVIIPPQYDYIERKGNYYKLRLNNRWGIANRKGTIIWDCIYPEIIELPDKFVVQELNVKELPLKELPKETE